jgi:hypothetical protein
MPAPHHPMWMMPCPGITHPVHGQQGIQTQQQAGIFGQPERHSLSDDILGGFRSGEVISGLLPWPMSSYLQFQRPAEKCPDENDGPGAVIATSNKRDIVDVTRPIRSKAGQVWVFDPQAVAVAQAAESTQPPNPAGASQPRLASTAGSSRSDEKRGTRLSLCCPGPHGRS